MNLAVVSVLSTLSCQAAERNMSTRSTWKAHSKKITNCNVNMNCSLFDRSKFLVLYVYDLQKSLFIKHCDDGRIRVVIFIFLILLLLHNMSFCFSVLWKVKVSEWWTVTPCSVKTDLYCESDCFILDSSFLRVQPTGNGFNKSKYKQNLSLTKVC
jgi:hypothetical protein